MNKRLFKKIETICFGMLTFFPILIMLVALFIPLFNSKGLVNGELLQYLEDCWNFDVYYQDWLIFDFMRNVSISAINDTLYNVFANLCANIDSADVINTIISYALSIQIYWILFELCNYLVMKIHSYIGGGFNA